MTKFSIPEMSCGHCKAVIEKTLKSLDPQVVLEFDMAARVVDVQSSASPDNMRDALKSAGYEAMPA